MGGGKEESPSGPDFFGSPDYLSSIILFYCLIFLIVISEKFFEKIRPFCKNIFPRPRFFSEDILSTGVCLGAVGMQLSEFDMKFKIGVVCT